MVLGENHKDPKICYHYQTNITRKCSKKETFFKNFACIFVHKGFPPPLTLFFMRKMYKDVLSYRIKAACFCLSLDRRIYLCVGVEKRLKLLLTFRTMTAE